MGFCRDGGCSVRSSSSEKDSSPSVSSRWACNASVRTFATTFCLELSICCSRPSGTEKLIPAAPSCCGVSFVPNIRHMNSVKGTSSAAATSRTLTFGHLRERISSFGSFIFIGI